jgi:hypothetical protein
MLRCEDEDHQPLPVVALVNIPDQAAFFPQHRVLKREQLQSRWRTEKS